MLLLTPGKGIDCRSVAQWVAHRQRSPDAQPGRGQEHLPGSRRAGGRCSDGRQTVLLRQQFCGTMSLTHRSCLATRPWRCACRRFSNARCSCRWFRCDERGGCPHRQRLAASAGLAAAVAGRALARTGVFRWQLTGKSMEPTLPHGCEIEIVPLSSKLPLGTVVVFANGSSLVAHRLVHRSRGYLVTQGDGRRAPDRWLLPAQLMGWLKKARSDGRRIWPGRERRWCVGVGWDVPYALAGLRRMRRWFAIHSIRDSHMSGHPAAAGYRRHHFRTPLPAVDWLDALQDRYRPFAVAAAPDWVVTLKVDPDLPAGQIRPGPTMKRQERPSTLHTRGAPLILPATRQRCFAPAVLHAPSAADRVLSFICTYDLPRRHEGLLLHGAAMVRRGQGLALSGRSGAGKTTALALLPAMHRS